MAPAQLRPPVDVVTWRWCRLLEAGFPPDLARRLSSSTAIDLHALLELVDRGCPAELAAGSCPRSRPVRRPVSIVGSDAPVPPELGLVDAEPEDWIEALTSPGPAPGPRDGAAAHICCSGPRATRCGRMRSSLGGAGHARLDEIANQAADEAMMNVLAKLHTFEGRSRFTTWAYKFAILQSATEVRRLAVAAPGGLAGRAYGGSVPVAEPGGARRRGRPSPGRCAQAIDRP
jgi:RNA polymerase sigma-70 factor (ECF subfamily)